jgi:hypothetical protein
MFNTDEDNDGYHFRLNKKHADEQKPASEESFEGVEMHSMRGPQNSDTTDTPQDEETHEGSETIEI